MRNPNRLAGLYKRIEALHKMFPDQRLSQFLVNIFNEFKEDPFYMEDEQFVSKVEEIVTGWLKNKSDRT